MKKQGGKLLMALLAMAVAMPVFAADLRLAAGGLLRDEKRRVAQVGVDVGGFQPTYTVLHKQRAVSLLYGKRWKYFEAAGGVAYLNTNNGDEGAAAHVRLGPRFGPVFVSYEVLIRDGEAVRFLLGGVQF